MWVGDPLAAPAKGLYFCKTVERRYSLSEGRTGQGAARTRAEFLESFTCPRRQRYSWSDEFCGRAASVGGTRRRSSPQQLKEVILMTHINVGSVASLGALVGGGVHR
jgi:hypothetical protein